MATLVRYLQLSQNNQRSQRNPNSMTMRVSQVQMKNLLKKI